jgi:hypothetical protein
MTIDPLKIDTPGLNPGGLFFSKSKEGGRVESGVARL